MRKMLDEHCCSAQLMLLFGRCDFMSFIIRNIDRIVDPIPDGLHEHAGDINMA